MSKRIVYIAIFGIVLTAFSSCRAISSLLNEGEVVAQVDAYKLYRNDVDKMIPSGLSAQDSTVMARQIIDSWARDIVYLSIAEEQLSKAEKDVSKELEEYRKSLLKYRYEQLYVNERLDTLVTEDMVEEYYEAHQDNFILDRPVVKARLLVIPKDSPMREKIKKKMSSSDVEDLIEADSLAYSSAMKFMTWNDEWVDSAELAREFGKDFMVLQSSLRGGWMEQSDTAGVMTMAYINEVVKAGEYAPIEYCTPAIKDIIIGARKQALISTLEQELLDEARENVVKR